MAVLQPWRVWFWDAKFGLPENSTWQDLEEAKNLSWVQSGELYLCFPVAIALIVLRFLFERFIAPPIVQYLGVKDQPTVFVPNTDCEKVYQTISKTPNAVQVEGLSKQLGWSTCEVKRWFKNRRQQSKPSVMRKALESSWKFAFYLVASIYGFVILHKKTWLWDLRLTLIGHGKHPLTDEIYYYYLFEVGFCLSQMIFLFLEVKRKDFWQMLIHHAATLLLTTFSYTAGFFRIGCVIMLLHDLSDIILESGKVLKYAKWDATCNIIFIIFAVVFNATRLLYFPFWVLRTALNVHEYCGYFTSSLWFLGLLLCLQVLHIYWSYKIAEMAFLLIIKGEMKGDIRSDEEAEINKEDGVMPDNKKKQ